ncbi:phage tail sheath subtilisin-like domain-containing protein [Nonomuraea sp. NPDC050153]|uniref:phage tail sheath subtilisin-like domain-containing protein n=1 Tax=Nonomuraea sp. NPDC050153 TaxID=3364359 RepID=UPI0037A2DDB1
MAGGSVLPGLSVVAVPPQAEPSPLRSDIAGVIGRTRRGPVGQPRRVAGARELESLFGGLDPRFLTGYALRGYLGNGGQVVHVLRLDGAGGIGATGRWELGDVADAGFGHTRYEIRSTDPGEWADRTRITIDYLNRGGLSFRIEVPGEAPEFLTGIAPEEVVAALARSRFVRLVPGGPVANRAPGGSAGPAVKSWEITLDGGADPVPRREDYLDAARRLGELMEVALVLVPDLHPDLGAEAVPVLHELLRDATERQDRLVLIDLPPDRASPGPAVAWTGALHDGLPPERRRSAAVYHPWIRVTDPFGGTRSPLRAVPPSGHVAGLASRLDRERGAQHTPANALLADALDLAVPLDRDQQSALTAGGLNVLRCRPGRGLEVWGGRTLDRDPARRFVAHRRLLHRLVRAIRRVAEPLVFEPDGPVLRFTLVRAVRSVLLESWRAGGLKGATPDEGFRVRCDDGNNPPAQTELGQLECEILLAPAAPMEFLRVLLTLTPQGVLAVVES